MTSLDGLQVEVRALRSELQAYCQRHEHELDELRQDIRSNTQHRLQTEAQLRILKWLIGSNIGVLVGVVVVLLTYLRG